MIICFEHVVSDADTHINHVLLAPEFLSALSGDFTHPLLRFLNPFLGWGEPYGRPRSRPASITASQLRVNQEILGADAVSVVGENPAFWGIAAQLTREIRLLEQAYAWRTTAPLDEST
ncbi:hypothetical protein AB1K56_04940 [Microbacterium sp. BWR-S6Y]|uniref:hypothetical protein n=1 Tax=Microbacterium sp. BWR-S6Y TaxID=3232073 RepID=UPI0035297992